MADDRLEPLFDRKLNDYIYVMVYCPYCKYEPPITEVPPWFASLAHRKCLKHRIWCLLMKIHYFCWRLINRVKCDTQTNIASDAEKEITSPGTTPETTSTTCAAKVISANKESISTCADILVPSTLGTTAEAPPMVLPVDTVPSSFRGME